MPQFVDKVRELSDSVAQQSRRMALIQNRKARENLSQVIARAEAEARDKLYPLAREQIVHAAVSGQRYHTVEILAWSDEATHEPAEAKVRVLTELLREQGFDVEVLRDTVEPRGSDPLFPNTVYNVSIRITW